METPKLQKKTTKKFLNKLFNNSSKKNTAVSPQNEWFPSFTVSDVGTHGAHHTNSPYSHATNKNRHSNEDIYQQQSINRSNSVQRRYSYSNVHESGRQRLLAAKRAEYQEKMQAFDDLIQKRRGSTLRLALAPDVASY
ncbi:hypothetical protein RclHR1_00530019 [Rhizophagus clarus]|uniref:Uncharacterized protein n=1 Tax=Rhizophagus clarus TaxID=94130 RepID=A0A2Z6RMP2_9GLOM|nr:hypothetical protein RclHR1_00530019 [Rhizophagus clarus]GES81315.1 hypothetical protein RCL_jg11934.t1 [Rhizophagus clarus]